MSMYVLRGLQADVLKRARAKAKESGTTIDAVLARFLETYAEHGHPQSIGGKTSMGNRTPEERQAFAKAGAAKRWETKDNPEKKGS